MQKGNAPEERKIQRLFRNPRRDPHDQALQRLRRRRRLRLPSASWPTASRIDLNAVRKKYEGLDGTELAISESQERMAVVVAPEDAEAFIAAATAENLEAYQVAVVTESPRMVHDVGTARLLLICPVPS